MRGIRSFVIRTGVVLWFSMVGAGTHAANVEERSFSDDPLVDGNTQFALDLYALLRNDHGNLLVSPYGVSTALAMTSVGAHRETLTQFFEVLHVDLPPAELHPSIKALRERLIPAGDAPGSPELHIANRLWGDRDTTFRGPFLETIRENYEGAFESVGFSDHPEEARRAINTWIEKQTRNRIKELLHSSDLSSATVLVLTNAIHFKSAWQTRFDEKDTREAEFFIDPERSVRVPFMRLTADLSSYEDDHVRIVELPYEGEQWSMVLLVPRARDGLAALEDSLTTASLGGWIDGLQRRTVHVVLPRFKLADRRHLEGTLAAMGMPLAFTPGQADFSGMCGDPGAIWIDLVVHQTYIEVDEEGTEASASAAVVLKRGDPPIISADHPFIFLIRDRETGSVLFMGRCADPS